MWIQISLFYNLHPYSQVIPSFFFMFILLKVIFSISFWPSIPNGQRERMNQQGWTPCWRRRFHEKESSPGCLQNRRHRQADYYASSQRLHVWRTSPGKSSSSFWVNRLKLLPAVEIESYLTRLTVMPGWLQIAAPGKTSRIAASWRPHERLLVQAFYFFHSSFSCGYQRLLMKASARERWKNEKKERKD